MNKQPTLTKLSRIYLVVHALNWLEITPEDPRRKTQLWEQWPGRCEICHQYEFGLKEKYYRLLSVPDEAAGVFFLPSGLTGDIPLIELARKTFGNRCAVCAVEGSPERVQQAFGVDFADGLEADWRRVIENRGRWGLSKAEWDVWVHSKAWAIDLDRQLARAGYTYDPATVEFIALGEDWSGCAATYPIHMGRAFGLTKPIERRFDLINPDCSPVLLRATAIEQNLAMPENIRLFIFKSAERRLLAQYWEGMRGPFDKPHVVEVSFPPASVRLIDAFGNPRGECQSYAEGLERFNRRLIDVFGNPRGDHQGCSEALERFSRHLIDVFGNPRGGLNQGDICVDVGCGLHTPYGADLALAEPELSLGEFRRALLAGRVVDKAVPEK
ncbi:MAG: hypothetical protein CVU38_08070 [Chloroflexi bacterium HGW-Chloroflexi-1]|nr:MAG: hypothetical protein CVU38_08070 [Chloroflexi bacterium HGW-Chloroflexi-1]